MFRENNNSYWMEQASPKQTGLLVGDESVYVSVCVCLFPEGGWA